MYRTFILFIVTMFTVQAMAGDSIPRARKYSNEFLAIGVGARALGMSNASVASTNDVTSGYWNPVGLLDIESNLQVGLMHSEYFAGIAKYDYGALATKIDSNSAIGFSVVRFGVDNIPNTTELIDKEGNINYDRITSFSAVDYAFIISYARRMKIPGLSLGANVKVINRKVGDFAKSWGFGLDIGAKYIKKNWRMAVMARDITTTYNAWSYNLSDEMKQTFIQTGNEIPENSVEITTPKVILALARQETIKEKITILAELNGDFTFDGKRNVLVKSNTVSIDPHLGVEIGYASTIFLRGGIGNIQEVTADIGTRTETTFQPNFGVGLNIKPINLVVDYAFTDVGDQSVGLYSHVFSLKFNFYKQPVK